MVEIGGRLWEGCMDDSRDSLPHYSLSSSETYADACTYTSHGCGAAEKGSKTPIMLEGLFAMQEGIKPSDHSGWWCLQL